MDYEKEIQKLNNGTNTFRPEEGEYKIVIIGEPEPTEYIENEGQENESRTPQIKLNIQVNQENKTWYIGIGKTFNSVYGQLIAIGKAKGKLNGELITLSVKRSNDRNVYTIKEASNLIPNEEEKVF